MSILRGWVVLVAFLTLELGQLAKGESPEKDSKPDQEKTQPVRNDLYGDPLPAGAIARMGTVRFRHGRGVHSIVFTRDGKTLASAGADGIRMWDGATGKQLRIFGDRSVRVTCLSLSPDDKILASGGDDKLVHLWDMPSGQEIRRFQGHQFQVNAVAFSPDGKVLASAGAGQAVRIWEVATGRVLELIGHQGKNVPGGRAICQIRGLAFSPDGKMLASAAILDERIRVWDVATGKELRSLPGNQGGVFSVRFSTDGKTLFSGGVDQTIRRWDVASWKELRRWGGKEGYIFCVSPSPDGKILALGADSCERGERKDLKLTVSLWDAATGKLLRRIRGPRNQAHCLAFSPDGKTLASGGSDSVLHLFDLASGKELHRFPGHDDAIWSISLSADGKTLASGGDEPVIHIWDAVTGQELRRLEGHEDVVSSLAFSPDGKKLASGSWDGTIRLWNPAQGKELSLCEVDSSSIRSLAYSPDGQTVAFAGRGVGLLELPTGKVVRRWEERKNGASVTLSPNGKLLACGCEDGTICLWDLATGKLRHQSHQNVVSRVAFSPDGKLLANTNVSMTDWESDNQTVCLWEVGRGKQIRVFESHEGAVVAITFSPDGKLLASACGTGEGGKNSALLLWEVATGMERQRFLGHQAGVRSVAFFPDGRKIASGSADSTGLVWDLTARNKNGRSPAGGVSKTELDELWARLAGEDAAKADEAIWTLAAIPNQGVPFLKEHLQPVKPVDAQRLLQLISDLDSQSFNVRQKANVELEKLAELAEAALRKALASHPPLDVRRHIEFLLERLEKGVPAPETLQALRATEVLEHIGTPEAQEVLTNLAKGAAEARLTQEAMASLERLAKRGTERP